jgi:hypothetical protein
MSAPRVSMRGGFDPVKAGAFVGLCPSRGGSIEILA